MLVCFTEEESAKALLDIIIPKVVGSEMPYRCVSFEGKQDLMKQIERKLKGWNVPETVFLILIDQDSNDCSLLKQKILDKINNTGKSNQTKVRIACHELESFYLGDLLAVEKALDIRNIAKQQSKSKFRTPDMLGNAKQELETLTNYTYREITGSETIAPHLDLLGKNKSQSFNTLVSTIKALVATNL